MNTAGRDVLVVAMLVLLIGSSIVQTKKVLTKSTEDYDHFEERGTAYYLPDGIVSWDKFNELTPCCTEGEDIQGCSVCNDSVVWKFKRKDHGLTVCTAVPSRAMEAMKWPYNARRQMVWTASEAGSIRGDGGILLGRRSLGSHDPRQGHAVTPNPLALAGSHRPRNSLEFKKGSSGEYVSDVTDPISPSTQPTTETGFLDSILSHLYFPERPVGLSFNLTEISQEEPRRSAVKCRPTVATNYEASSTAYLKRGTLEQIDNGHDSASSDNTNELYPPSMPYDEVESLQRNLTIEEEFGNTNVNVNINRTKKRKDRQNQRKQKGNTSSKDNDSKSKKLESNAVKPGVN